MKEAHCEVEPRAEEVDEGRGRNVEAAKIKIVSRAPEIPDLGQAAPRGERLMHSTHVDGVVIPQRPKQISKSADRGGDDGQCRRKGRTRCEIPGPGAQVPSTDDGRIAFRRLHPFHAPADSMTRSRSRGGRFVQAEGCGGDPTFPGWGAAAVCGRTYELVQERCGES